MQMIMQRRSSSLQFGILPGNIPGESTRLKISLSGGRGYPEGIDAFHPSRIGKKLAQKKWAQGGRKVKLPKTPFPGSSACGARLPELSERQQQAERHKQNNRSHFGPVLWRQSPLASLIRKKLDSHE